MPYTIASVKSPRYRAAVLLAVLALSASAAVLSACNTVAGAGQDVSATGRAVTNTSDRVRQGL